MNFIEIIVPMAVDVDGAPNAYGPDNSKALDFELNAHVHAQKSGRIVGYLTQNDDGRTPVVQQFGDPCPGFYISQTAYADKQNGKVDDPRRYVNAAEINYTLLARKASQAGVELGDICVVHSKRTGKTVYAIVGDSGNSLGTEGSLALLQKLGYDVKSGKSGPKMNAEIAVRYFPKSNPNKLLFTRQQDLDKFAHSLQLDGDLPEFEPRTEPFAPLTKDLAEKPLVYPGSVLKLNSDDLVSVMLIEERLFELGYTESTPGGVQPLTVNGVFDIATFEAVQLFQVRHTDVNGVPLEPNGEVGPETWGALFGPQSVPAQPRTEPGALLTPLLTSDGLLQATLAVAADEIGVREVGGPNRGPRVEEYQKAVGIDPGDPWCAAFVYFCFQSAARDLGVDNPLEPKFRTGAVMELWARARAAGIATLTHDAAVTNSSLVEPGMIFIIQTGGGHGHTGFVEDVKGNTLVTIEGNTNDDGSAEGIGVFRRTGRSIASINTGFILFKG